MKAQIERIGIYGCRVLVQTGTLGMFMVHCLIRMVTPPFNLKRIISQIHFIGGKSAFVIISSGLFTGMVVALQFHDTLVRFGSVELIGSAVALSLIRELGPVITALMVTGRAGSSICAEIGIMRVSEQIDALECMGIDPYRFMITAKFWAGIISIPLLTAMFNIAGIIGGNLVAVKLFEVGQGVYVQGLYQGVNMNDIMMGCLKSFVFAWLIIWICSAKGFLLHKQHVDVFGAEGVSRVTTDAVVLSSISILVADFLIGAFLL